jgi:ATP/ADP translocase
MRNLAFVIWATIYPITVSAVSYLFFLEGFQHSHDERDFEGFVNLVIWVWIGTLLYEKRIKGIKVDPDLETSNSPNPETPPSP